MPRTEAEIIVLIKEELITILERSSKAELVKLVEENDLEEELDEEDEDEIEELEEEIERIENKLKNADEIAEDILDDIVKVETMKEKLQILSIKPVEDFTKGQIEDVLFFFYDDGSDNDLLQLQETSGFTNALFRSLKL